MSRIAKSMRSLIVTNKSSKCLIFPILPLFIVNMNTQFQNIFLVENILFSYSEVFLYTALLGYRILFLLTGEHRYSVRCMWVEKMSEPRLT